MAKLPDRRTGLTDSTTYVDEKGNLWKLLITCNFDPADGRIKEVFPSNPLKGADLDGLLIDGCILLSLCLQAGVPLDKVATTLSERRPERGTSGPPASMIGAIAKLALKIDEEYKGETGTETNQTRST